VPASASGGGRRQRVRHGAGGEAADARRVDQVRGDGVDPDAVLGQLERHRAREVDDRGLARGVDGVVGGGPAGLDAGDVDDRPAVALPDHHRGGRGHAGEHADQVHLDVPAPAPLGLGQERRPPHPTGVVDQDVQASEAVDRRLDHGRHLGGVAHVRRRHGTAAPQVLHPAGRDLGPVGVDVGDDHVGPRTGEADGDALPDAGPTARDQGDPAVQAA
jgi:hypothetical protein